ncbi:MAG: F0F1 ATP synthase subunit B family protein [Alphaproteobacteria bacterium]
MAHLKFLYTIDFWIFFTFGSFLLILLKKAAPAIGAGLDSYIEKIRTVLDNATNKKEDALKTLNFYKRKQQQVEDETAEIIEKAKKEMIEARDEAFQKHEKLVQRREEQALDKIALLEEQAVADIRNVVTNTVIKSAEKIFSDLLTESEKNSYLDASVEEISKKLN